MSSPGRSPGELSLGDPGIDTVLIMLVVPSAWKVLPVEGAQEPHLSQGLAQEVKRWAGSNVLDLSALRAFLEERGA